tara:strand:- start:7559 stop:7729 length:171 start_codon:yes stop_codon:yes gene_type:complete
MDKDRNTMIEELLPLGLHRELLDKLSDTHVFDLHKLIGWASPVFVNNKKKGTVNDS